MTIEEIKSKICDLRCSVEELQEQAQNLWKETDDKRTENVADYLHYELTTIASHLADLEDSQVDEDEANEHQNDNLNDWWDELDNVEKSEIANIPMPTADDGGRGDNQFEFDERTRKWWDSRTLEQKQEIYEDNLDTLPWWDKE